MTEIHFNLNENKLDKNGQYYGTLKITYNPKNLIFEYIDENRNLINSAKRELDYKHKGIDIGRKIAEKFQPNSEIYFENLNFKWYDISQPDLIMDEIWVKIFNEHIQ